MDKQEFDPNDFTDYEEWGKFCPDCDVKMTSLVVAREDHMLITEYTCPICSMLIEE